MRLKAASVIIGAAMLLTACAAGTPEAEAPSSPTKSAAVTPPADVSPDSDLPFTVPPGGCTMPWLRMPDDCKVMVGSIAGIMANSISPTVASIDDEAKARAASFYCDQLANGITKKDAQSTVKPVVPEMAVVNEDEMAEFYSAAEEYMCPEFAGPAECTTTWGEQDKDYKTSALAVTTVNAKQISPQFAAVNDESIIKTARYYCDFLSNGMSKEQARAESWFMVPDMYSLPKVDQDAFYALLDTTACPCS